MKVHFVRWLAAISEQAVPRQEFLRTAGELVRRIVAVSEEVAYGANVAVENTRRTVAERVPPGLARSAAKVDLRKAALVIAALAFVGGVAAGPGGTAEGAPPVRSAHSGRAQDRSPAVARDDDKGSDRDGHHDAPGRDKLIPHGTQGAQSNVSLSREQFDNAKVIVRTAKKLGLPDRAAVIGVATSLQESKLNNFGNLGDFNDHDSLGLFQQRPSAGWGTPEQLTDPEYAATAFFMVLEHVDDWQDLPLTDAAQTVQGSAFPFAYAQWEQQAADIVQAADSD